jgi:membrane protein
MRARWRSFKGIVDLWVDLFDRHNLLTYASAIAFQTFIAFVAFVLLALGILGATNDEELWSHTISPAIEGRVLPDVYAGINAIVEKVFAHSTGGLVAFASALAIWEVSGVVRASGGALNAIYEVDEQRSWKLRFPVSFALACGLIATILGAVALIWLVHLPGGWDWPLAIVRWLGAIALLIAGFGLIVRFAPCETRATRWASVAAVLVVAGWIGESLIVRWFVRSQANFRSPIGSLELFIFAAGYLYTGAIILLVGLQLDELLRQDLTDDRRPRLLPLVAGVIRGSP